MWFEMQNTKYDTSLMKKAKDNFLVVNESGELKLPADVVRRYGLKPGAEVYFEESAHALLLHRPISHLARVNIEPTNQCNLSCRTCVRNVWEAPPGHMGSDIFGKIVEGLKAFSPIPLIFFGGFGEPLAHPEIIPMIRTCKELGARVEAVTNGVLLTEKCTKQLIEVGLDRLWVSLDGATPQGYADARQGDVFPQITKNLRNMNLVKVRNGTDGFEVGVVFVATKRNIKELPAVIRFGAQIGARAFLVSNVLPYSSEFRDEVLYGRSLWNWKSYLNPMSLPRMDVNRETSAAIEELLSIYEWTAFNRPEFLKPFDTCPFVEKGSLSVRWDGMVSPCIPLLYSYASYLDDKVRHNQEYAVGSITKESLQEIWESPEYVALRKRIREFDFSPCTKCNACEMAESNQEDCFGNRFPVCGGCLWAQGFIRCP